MHEKLEFIISLRDKFTGATNKINAAFDRTVGRSRKLSSSIEQLQNRLSMAQAGMQKTTDRNAFRFYYNEAKRLERQIDRLERGITGSRIGATIQGWRSDLAGSLPGAHLMRNPLVLSTAAIGGFWSATTQAMEAGKEKMRMQVLTGSEEIGAALFDGLTKFATDTVFGDELYEIGAMMLGYGVKDSELLPIMEQLGDIAQGDAQKLGSLALAFSQINSLGKLMGQDLNQMINAGFNPLVVISEATGESMESLREKMAKGQLTIDHVKWAMTQATGEGGKFHNMLDKVANTPYGQLEQLRGQFKQMFIEIVNVFLPIATKLMGVISWLGDKAGPYLKPFVAILGLVSVALLALAAAQWVANLAVWAFPGTWIIAAIVALIGVILWLATSVKGWGDAWNHVMDGAKSILAAFVQAGKAQFNTLIQGFMINIDKLRIAWVKFKNFIGIGDKSANNQMIADLNRSIEDRQKSIIDGYVKAGKLTKEGLESLKKAGGALSWESFDLGGIVPPGGIPGAAANMAFPELGKNSKDAKKTNSAIATGGTRHNYITINLNDLIGHLTIHGKTFKETTSEMEDQVLDAMLRVIGSATTAGG